MRGEKMACSRCLGSGFAPPILDTRSRTAPQHHHRRCSEGHLPRAPGRTGVAHLGSSEIGYSLRVRRVLGAGSRSALPLRFSVVFEYGGLIP